MVRIELKLRLSITLFIISTMSFAGDNISKEDILFNSRHVCIVEPASGKGVLVWHRCKKENEALIKQSGLRASGKHGYSFFRAPFMYCEQVDRSSPESELQSLYGGKTLEDVKKTDTDSGYIFIRVDPRQTYVYPSELRVKIPSNKKLVTEMDFSKKLLSGFLLTKNKEEEQEGKCQLWNLNTGNTIWRVIRNSYSMGYCDYDSYLDLSVEYPYSEHNIKYQSEILVDMDVIPPSYFVNWYLSENI